MDERPATADWRVILLLLFSLAGALAAISTALVMLAITAINFLAPAEWPSMDASPVSSLLIASTLTAVGLLFLPIGYYSLQRLRGRPQTALILPPLRPWTWILLPLLWVVLAILAALFYDGDGVLIYAPALHFLAVALPLYLLVRAAANRISLGSPLRAWSVLGSSMSLSLAVAIALEIAVLAIVVIAAASVTAVVHPAALDDILSLLNKLESATDLESLLSSLAPIIEHPLTLVAALFFLSGFTPLIEEFAKSLGVWLVSGRLSSPAQGFALGALSGAGFALVESLSASLSPDESWAFAFAARAFSGLMHVLAAGLMGLGVAYARLEKRYARLAGLALLAALIHAAWNAGAVLVAIGSLRITLADPEIDLAGTLLGMAGLLLLLFMAASMAVGLLVLNARLARAESRSLPTPPAPEPLPTSP